MDWRAILALWGVLPMQSRQVRVTNFKSFCFAMAEPNAVDPKENSV
jgi:hypothetical protein